MTLWQSVITVVLFSIAVIVIDEIMHARRRKRGHFRLQFGCAAPDSGSGTKISARRCEFRRRPGQGDSTSRPGGRGHVRYDATGNAARGHPRRPSVRVCGKKEDGRP